MPEPDMPDFEPGQVPLQSDPIAEAANAAIGEIQARRGGAGESSDTMVEGGKDPLPEDQLSGGNDPAAEDELSS
jgi:hypothetical protein